MWCLARLLPLLIGELVSPNEIHWESFLLLLTIIDYAFAPITSEDTDMYLKGVINDHHVLFWEVYSSCPVIPKMHYIIHLPEWIIR